ncbi:hypothetical protein [Phreatobacter sp.]|uniref:hypothetical protein n=1 Tax=Phreatobacter sp. TaxID=1966341 RepID=UPI003F6FF027
MKQARANQTPDRNKPSDRLQDRYAAIGIQAVAAAAPFVKPRRPDRIDPEPRRKPVDID